MGIRSIKPTTPANRFATRSDFSEITRDYPEKSLTKALRKTGGRNNNGRITVRHRGGGHRRRYRIIDFKRESPDTLIRLMGHSLGAHVIYSTVKNLAKNVKNKGIIEAVYLFGGSIPANAFSTVNGSEMQKIVATKIKNYYGPHDDVLRLADEWNWVPTPIGYRGSRGKTIQKYTQTMVKPKNHRFASYAKVLNSFP